MRKNNILLILVNLVFFCELSISTAQVISGNVSLNSQAEVNSFIGTSITGKLTINNSDITDLSPLITLTSVGDLNIKNNDKLTNLDGLNGIASVGLLIISYNDILINLDGLSNITSVENGLSILSNDALTNLDGLSNITSVGSLGISGNLALTNINSLNNITNVDDILIWNNSSLANIDGLSSLDTVHYGMDIGYNNVLINIDGLNDLTFVQFELNITNNSALRNLDGFSKLTYVGGEMRINNNDSLMSFCGLYPLLFAIGWPGNEAYYPFGNMVNPTPEQIINAGPCTTSIEVAKNDLAPKKYELQQNYPNPFNPNTTISYTLPKNGLVQLKVYDMLGREVASLVNEEQSMGSYKIEFNASALTSGIYFYRLQSSDFTETKKLILLR